MTLSLPRRPARRRTAAGSLFVLTLAAAPAAAQPAKVFVNSAVLAIGDRPALLDLKSQRIVSHGENFEPDLSPRPGASAPKVSEFRCVLYRDLEAGRFRSEWQRRLTYPHPGVWEYAEVVSGLDGVVLGHDGFGSPPRRAMSSARIAARRKELRRSPVSVLVHALSRADSFLRLMDQTIRGRRHVVVSFTDNDQLVVLAIDAETRLLAKVGFVEDDPLYGDVQNEVFFDDWRQVGKLTLPFALTYRVNGQTVMVEHVDEIENDADLTSVDFTIPDDVDFPDEAGAEWQGQRGEYGSHRVLRRLALGLPAAAPRNGVGLRELAPGVMQIVGGRFHSLAVEMGEYLIVVEAPEDDRHSRAVLDTLRTRFPTKQVRYVVNTHFHAAQAGGLRAYVAADATVVTAALNVPFFQDVFGALHTQVPDALHRRPRDAVIEAVRDERKFFVDEHRVVIVFPVETAHADGMLLVHLPEEGLLFASELFTPGAPQQVAEWCRDLLRAIEAQRLDVETIVGSRGGVGSLAELRRAVRESADDANTPSAASAAEHGD